MMNNLVESVKSHLDVFIFNITYLLLATLFFIQQKNFEFLWYLAVLFFFFFLIMFTLTTTHFDRVILWGLSIWGLLHLLGGGLVVQGEVLYNFVFIHLYQLEDVWILKFDQVVHFFGFGVATLVCAAMISSINKDIRLSGRLYFLLFCMGMGLGALNEIVEFLAVTFIPDTNVGGYVNTSFDLVSNALGCAFALIWVPRYFNQEK